MYLPSKFFYFRARIPVSNAVTAMEVWLLACMMLVFFSLVEYTIILKKGVSHNRQLEKIKKDANYVKAPNGVSRTFYWIKFDVWSKSGSSLQLLISLLKLLNSRVITQVCRHTPPFFTMRWFKTQTFFIILIFSVRTLLKASCCKWRMLIRRRRWGDIRL